MRSAGVWVPLLAPARVSSSRVGALPYARHALHAANARGRHAIGANLTLESRRPRRVPVLQAPGRDRLKRLTKGSLTVQPFTPPPTSPVSHGDNPSPDNHSLCNFEPLERLQAFAGANPSIPTSNTPNYTATGYTKCRLVVERGDQRSNSAAHVRIGGASCNDLAVIEIQGVAGYVSLAVAGDNLRALVDALSGLVTACNSAPTGEPDNAGDLVIMSASPETGAA